MDDRPNVTPEGVVSGPSVRPPNFVAAVIDNAQEFERALEDLVAAGIAPESMGILQGERGAEAMADLYESRSWLQRVGDMLSDEREYVDRYKEAAREGHFVVGVPLPDRSEATRQRIEAILSTHGAHSLLTSTRWSHSGDE